jgi:hypothetical protein
MIKTRYGRGDLIVHALYLPTRLSEQFRQAAFDKHMQRGTILYCLTEMWLAGLVDIDSSYKKRIAERALNLENNKKNGKKR